MKHPYKTREGGATVTIFVPYDCKNHCPFCINKGEYADMTGFSAGEDLPEHRADGRHHARTATSSSPGASPSPTWTSLQVMLDKIPTTHKVYINTTLPVSEHQSEADILAFAERNRAQDHLHQRLPPHAALCGGVQRRPAFQAAGALPGELRAVQELSRRAAGALYGAVPQDSRAPPSSSGSTTPPPHRRTSMRRRGTKSSRI